MHQLKNKIAVSVLGATGMVGQNYLRLLENHPWFQVVDVAASPRSAGKTYAKAVGKNWFMKSDIPNKIKELIVRDVNDFEKIPKNVSCVFSAIELSEKEDTRNLEFKYAKADYALISNSSANRFTNDVPMIIPEINPEHTGIIPIQRSNRNLPENGFIAAKPNCSIQSYLVTLYALEKAGANASESVMIGDNLEVDALGAQKAGLRGIWFNPEQRLVQHSVIEITELVELLQIL